MNANYRAYGLLILLLVLSLGYWMGGASAVYDELHFGQVRSRLPFEFGFRTRTIVGITPEAVKAGAHVDDTLLEFGRRRFASYSVMRDAVLDAPPGTLVRAVVERPNGATATIAIRLAARHRHSTGLPALLPGFRSLGSGGAPHGQERLAAAGDHDLSGIPDSRRQFPRTAAGAEKPLVGAGVIHLARLDDVVRNLLSRAVYPGSKATGLRASLRGQTLGGPADLAAFMRNVNALLYEASAANRYATFFYAQYDPHGRKLAYANAGHNPPMVLRGGEVLRLEADGPVVGLLPHAQYGQSSLDLEPGDILLAYTDGISEAMTMDDEEWGEDRMIAAAQQCRTLAAGEMIDRLMATAGAPQHDDITLVVVKLLP